jgi:hypothetical protein
MSYYAKDYNLLAYSHRAGQHENFGGDGYNGAGFALKIRRKMLPTANSYVFKPKIEFSFEDLLLG